MYNYVTGLISKMNHFFLCDMMSMSQHINILLTAAKYRENQKTRPGGQDKITRKIVITIRYWFVSAPIDFSSA